MPSSQPSARARVDASLARVTALNRRGPKLGAILEVAPDARAQAAALDAERAQHGARGPLHGAVVALKDNIDTADGMHTTAGSQALASSFAEHDAFVVERLREAGAVVFAKANLTEWSAFVAEGFGYPGRSARAQTRNAHDPTKSPGGSSSGPAVAVASGMVEAAVGTETDGSLVCPAAANGIVGFKPTVGLISRRGIVGISRTHDTPGPMARTVAKASALLEALAGEDESDSSTRVGARRPVDFMSGLSLDALRGARLGVVRGAFSGYGAQTEAAFERALQVLRDAGAVLIDPVDLSPAPPELEAAQWEVLFYEFKAGIDEYLGGLTTDSAPHSLQELVEWNSSHGQTNQGLLEKALAHGDLNSPGYRRARALSQQWCRTSGPEAVLRQHGVEALIAPTQGPAGPLRPDAHAEQHRSFASPAAIANVPHLTVPMGRSEGVPIGLSIVGPAWADARVLALGYAFEQAAALDIRPSYPEAAPR